MKFVFYGNFLSIQSVVLYSIFCSCFQNIERVLLPHLSTYWPVLTAAMESQDPEHVLAKIDSHYVYAAILVGANSYIWIKSQRKIIIIFLPIILKIC